jgi:hypothetical protein
MARGESKFEQDTIAEIRDLFPGCIVMKNDSGYLQGVPDRLILWGPHWAALEFKRSAHERTEPNQPWYVETMNAMSFAAFVFPENKDEILHGLQDAFQSGRQTRFPRR